MKKTVKTKSYLAILAASKELFKKYGTRKVTLEEICEEAKVSKMTFYRFFENKIHLTENVLDEIHESALNKYRSIMKRDMSFAEKMKQVILLRYNEAGEVSEKFLNDIYKNTKLKKRLELQNKTSIAEFIKDLEEAKQKGEVREDLEPELALYMIGKLTESATDKNLLSLYDTPQKALMAITNYFFKGIGSK